MVNLEHYLNDGACAQARAVMAYLQNYYETILDNAFVGWENYNGYDCFGGAKIVIGRYDNDREQGYIFSLRYNMRQVNYAVYEHCVGDHICVQRAETGITDKPNVWPNGWDKYNQTATFDYFDIRGCGEWLVNDMKKYLDKFLAEEKQSGTEIE